MLDNEGKEVPGTRGYKYFGAAKDLPGVRELFEPEITGAPRKTRGELMRDVDADYYGYRDDDDGVLEPLELIEEEKALVRLEQEWREKMAKKKKNVEIEEKTEEEVTPTPVKNYFIEVPSQEEIEQRIIALKKKQMLMEYVSMDIEREGNEAKEMLGV
jgi:pre-mRNA-splicing factor ISY1